MDEDSSSSLHLAGMKETEGERVLRALKRLSEKIKKLENDRKLAKHKVESLATQTVTEPTTAGDFHRRLAKTEARCKLLEQQLSHIRKVVKETTILNIDDLHSYNSSRSFPPRSPDSSHNSTISQSLSSVTSTHNRRLKSPEPSRNDLRLRRSMPAAPSILDVPIFSHYQPSISSTQNFLPQVQQKPEKDGSEFYVVRDPPLSRTSLPSTRRSNSQRQEPVPTGVVRSAGSGLSDGSQRKLSGEKRPSRNCRRDSRGGPRDLSSDSNTVGRITPLGQFLPTQNAISTTNGGHRVSSDSHYHVRLNQMPFCSAASSGKSHSLSANLQSLLSMVKTCHPALCTAAPLHRLRSLSGDRQRHQPRNMTRWNSASDLGQSRRMLRRGGAGTRARSLSVDSLARRRITPPSNSALADLDLVPVRLKPRQPHREKVMQHGVGKSVCETPGNVCIRTEVTELPVGGSNKVVELKVTSSSCPKTRHACQLGKADTTAKRRQLLKNVREIQYMVENDQCC